MGVPNELLGEQSIQFLCVECFLRAITWHFLQNNIHVYFLLKNAAMCTCTSSLDKCSKQNYWITQYAGQTHFKGITLNQK